MDNEYKPLTLEEVTAAAVKSVSEDELLNAVINKYPNVLRYYINNKKLFNKLVEQERVLIYLHRTYHNNQRDYCYCCIQYNKNK